MLMIPKLDEFIEELHIGCMAIAFQAAVNEDILRERLVNYLHRTLADLSIDDQQRNIIDRMAGSIAADGLKLDYRAYLTLASDL